MMAVTCAKMACRYRGDLGRMIEWSRLIPTIWLIIINLQLSASADGVGCPVGIQITVVYNALIWPEQNWNLLIRGQLVHLVETGIAECANTHVTLSTPAISPNLTYENLEELLDQARRLVHEILPKRSSQSHRGAVVSQVHENSFEYPGLHLLYLLAQVRQ